MGRKMKTIRNTERESEFLVLQILLSRFYLTKQQVKVNVKQTNKNTKSKHIQMNEFLNLKLDKPSTMHIFPNKLFLW